MTEMSEKNIVILYHANCLDGFAAALVVWLTYGDSAEYIPVMYDEAPPNVTGKTVFILDFSYPREVLEQMYKDARSMVVLDHHKTAESALEGLNYCQFDMSRSGAMMTWRHFNKGIRPPMLIKLIQDRDLWKFEYSRTKPVTSMLFSIVERSFNVWSEYLDPIKLNGLAVHGEILNTYDKMQVEKICCHCHAVTLNGEKGLGVNTPNNVSDVGNLLAQTSGTFGLTYNYIGDKKLWLYSLRSIGDYDVSVIAKHYGGGGHKNASDFSLPDLIV
jgi:oligoribonuclease NrnB/cAMP/cGMP phosphodiesterase (DHH superfamily)